MDTKMKKIKTGKKMAIVKNFIMLIAQKYQFVKQREIGKLFGIFLNSMCLVHLSMYSYVGYVYICTIKKNNLKWNAIT